MHHARHPRKLNFINAVNPIYIQELGKFAFIYVVNSSYWCITKVSIEWHSPSLNDELIDT